METVLNHADPLLAFANDNGSNNHPPTFIEVKSKNFFIWIESRDPICYCKSTFGLTKLHEMAKS